VHVQKLKKIEKKEIKESIKKDYNNDCILTISNKLKVYSYTDIYKSYNIYIAIDSIHISTFLNPYDIKKDKINNFYIENKETNIIYIKKFNLYINNSVNINILFHIQTRTYTYEFSGLHQYKSLNSTLIYILRLVYKSAHNVKRIDIALDVFSDKSLFNINPIFKNFQLKSIENTLYINEKYSKNKKKVEVVIYPKILNSSKTLQVYSDITRIEVRMENSFLKNKKINDIFHETSSIKKLHKNLIDILNKCNITYANELSNFNSLKIEESLFNFIRFLESDENKIEYLNYKKFIGEVEKQNNILSKICNTYNIESMEEFNSYIKENKLTIHKISKECKIHRNTIFKIFKKFVFDN
jgi:hypothetical protein